MYGSGISEVFNFLLILIGLLFGWGVYSAYKMIKNKDIIESKTRIVPDYRLEANGKNIDTIFIYKRP